MKNFLELNKHTVYSIIWDSLKAFFRGLTVSCTSRKRKQNGAKLSSLESTQKKKKEKIIWKLRMRNIYYS